VPAEATVQQLMEAAAPLVGLDPRREQFLAADMGHPLQCALLPPTHKVRADSFWERGAGLRFDGS
jgi:hypothetical protein